MGADEVTRRVRVWLEELVIGRDLCPFARGPYEQGTVRLFVSEADRVETLLVDVVVEAERLVDADPRALETTLVIHPEVGKSFDEYNEALGLIEAVLDERDLLGEIQVVGFHPKLRFEGVAPDAVESYANRAPYPLVHLLRRASIERVAASYPNLEGIPARNSEILRAISRSQLQRWCRGER